VYHASGIILAVLTPVAFALSPSIVNLPIDIVLGVLFPIHSHVALNYIVSDYIPKTLRSPARGALLVASIIAAAGILKLNIEGPGLTQTIKSLWLKPEPKK
jgi:succinate dehydrogenase (ubiquinone) membrane anchor subunit